MRASLVLEGAPGSHSGRAVAPYRSDGAGQHQVACEPRRLAAHAHRSEEGSRSAAGWDPQRSLQIAACPCLLPPPCNRSHEGSAQVPQLKVEQDVASLDLALLGDARRLGVAADERDCITGDSSCMPALCVLVTSPEPSLPPQLDKMR